MEIYVLSSACRSLGTGWQSSLLRDALPAIKGRKSLYFIFAFEGAI